MKIIKGFLITIFIIIYIFIYFYYSKKSFKVIILTIFFPIENHHHSIDEYKNWTRKFFNIVQGDIVFFTDKRMKYILPKRNSIHSYFFNNVTSIPIIKKLKINEMVNKSIHKIYHSKIALLYYVSTQYKANMYFYNDISTFHFEMLENVKNYPNPDYLKSVFKDVDNPIFFIINPNRHHSDFIQGGCFGGNNKAIKYLYDVYYSFLNEYYRNNGTIAITEEQMLDIMIEKVKDAILIPNNPDNCQLYHILPWFYFINVLSGYKPECVKSLKFKYLKDY